MTQPTLMIGLGEILWDFLPSGKMLGGAPANFAYMASLLGNEGVVASRIGHDNLGREVLDMMRQMRLSSAFVQEDPEHLTGMVDVRLKADGQPEFEIKDSASWDFLEWTQIWADLASSADVVCYGTLAQRSPISRETIQQFLRAVSVNALLVYDVNLRGAFFTIEVLRSSFMLAHIAKLNVDELFRVSDLLNTGGSNEEERALRLLNEFDLRMICVTRGSEGSLLMSKDKTVVHSGFRIRVADAVGAGDSFAACLAHNYVLGKSLEEISESANRLAAWVATQAGATPAIPTEGLHEALQEIARQDIEPLAPVAGRDGSSDFG